MHNAWRGVAVFSVFVFSLFTSPPALAQTTDLPSFAKCTLSGREPAADGVFRIPETVRALRETFDVTCFMIHGAAIQGEAQVWAEMGEGSEGVQIGKSVVNFAPPAGSITIPADRQLTPGVYELVIRLTDGMGTTIAYESRLRVEVAVGEDYAVPEIREALEELDESLAPVETETRSPLSVKTVAIATVVVLLVLSLALIGYRVWRKRQAGYLAFFLLALGTLGFGTASVTQAATLPSIENCMVNGGKVENKGEFSSSVSLIQYSIQCAVTKETESILAYDIDLKILDQANQNEVVSDKRSLQLSAQPTNNPTVIFSPKEVLVGGRYIATVKTVDTQVGKESSPYSFGIKVASENGRIVSVKPLDVSTKNSGMVTALVTAEVYNDSQYFVRSTVKDAKGACSSATDTPFATGGVKVSVTLDRDCTDPMLEAALVVPTSGSTFAKTETALPVTVQKTITQESKGSANMSWWPIVGGVAVLLLALILIILRRRRASVGVVSLVILSFVGFGLSSAPVHAACNTGISYPSQLACETDTGVPCSLNGVPSGAWQNISGPICQCDPGGPPGCAVVNDPPACIASLDIFPGGLGFCTKAKDGNIGNGYNCGRYDQPLGLKGSCFGDYECVWTEDWRCVPPTVVNGACGSAKGGTFPSAPSSGLCDNGTVLWIDSSADDGQFNWHCVGSGPGGTTDTSCWANKQAVAQSCSISASPNPCIISSGLSSCSTTVDWNTTGYGGVDVYAGANLWASSGTGPGTGASGSWITPSGLTFEVRSGGAPLCSVTVTGQCENGTTYENGVCTAFPPPPAICGTNATTFAYNASGYTGTFCDTGNPTPANPAFPNQGGSVSWNCGAAQCTANRDNPPQCTPGVCGSSAGGTFASAPSTDLCFSGFGSSSVSETGSAWSWTCFGSESQCNTPCTANKLTAVGPPTGLDYYCNDAGTQATLSWNPVAGALTYPVRVDDTSGATTGSPTGPNNIGPVGNTEYVNDELNTYSVNIVVIPGRSYDWWVHAHNGLWGPQANGPTIKCLAPPTVSYVCLPGDTSVRFDYSSPGADEYLLRFDDSFPPVAPLVDDFATANTTWTKNGISPGVHYAFWAHARKSGGTNFGSANQRTDISASSNWLDVVCGAFSCQGSIPVNGEPWGADESTGLANNTTNWTYAASDSDPTPKCQFKCQAGFTWNNSTGQCEAPVACTGDTPNNATLCPGDDTGLSANTPRTLVAACSAPAGSVPKCQYTCNQYYTLIGGVCVQNACQGSIPNNAVSWGAGESTNLPNNTTSWTYSASNTSAFCEFRCLNGYNWDAASGQCIAPATGSISCTNCQIANGANSCNSTVTWSTTNASNPVVRQNATQFSPPSTSPATRTLTYASGATDFTVYDGVTYLNHATCSASCAPGLVWSATNNRCEDPPTVTGNITLPVCVIPQGQGSTTISVSWSTTNATSASMRQNDSQFSTALSNGGTPRSVNYGSGNSNKFDLYGNGTFLDTKTAVCNCTSGTSWDGDSCEPSAVTKIITFTNNGPITSGQQATLSWNVSNWASCEITRVSPLTGTLQSGINGTVPGSRLSGVLNATQTFRLTCTGGPGLPASDSRDTTVAVNIPLPTLTVVPNSCVIASNASSCGPLTVSWTNMTFNVLYSYTNPGPGTTYNQSNTFVGTAPNNPGVLRSVYFGPAANVFYSTTPNSPVVFASATCAAGSTWNGTLCAPNAPGPQPNLQTGAITPISTRPGVSTDFSATVRETSGTVSAGPFSTTFYYNTVASDVGRTGMGSVPFAAGLGRGASLPAMLSYTFPTAGTYYLKACADIPSDQVDETNDTEADNCGPWTQVDVSAGYSRVCPDSANITVGGSQQYRLWYHATTNITTLPASFCDTPASVAGVAERTADPGTVWSINPAGIANATATKGQYTGVAAGSATVQATYSSATDAASLTVSQPSLIVCPASATIREGQTNKILSSYHGSSSQSCSSPGTDVSSSANWSVSDTGILQNLGGGTFTGVAQGNTTVTATYSSLTSNVATVSVLPNCVKTCDPATAQNTCSGQTFTGTNTCPGEDTTCNGTRSCDFNWKEVAP